MRSACAADFRRSRTRAKTCVAACVTGVRQSPDCRHPLPLRRPRVFARPFRLFPEIGRTSRRALGCRSGRLAPAPAENAGRRGARVGRLRRGCGAMLSSRAAPHPHPPRHASHGGVLRLANSRLPLLRPQSSAHWYFVVQCALLSHLLSYSSYPPTRLISLLVLERRKSDAFADKRVTKQRRLGAGRRRNRLERP